MKSSKPPIKRKPKFKLIHGNPPPPPPQSPPKDSTIFVKAAVMGSRWPDGMPYFEEESDLTQAIEELAEVVELYPDDLELIHALGDLCVRSGKPAEAIKQFYLISAYYLKHNAPLKALAILKKIIKLDPGEVAAQLQIETLKTRLNLN